MSNTILLAQDFPPPDRAAWLALVAKTLKGAGLETLDQRTPDGLVLPALCDAATRSEARLNRPVRTGEAGETRAWDIRALVQAATPDAARSDAAEALEGGAASLLLRLGNAFESGQITKALEDVVLEIAPVALDAPGAGRTAARGLDAAAKASPGARLALHLDPLSAFAAGGAWPGDIEAEIAACADLAARLGETYPRASLVLASGQVAHEAGATPGQEIAFAAAAAVTYVRALAKAGLDLSEAWSRTVFGLALDAEPFAGIAKLRAARIVFHRLVGACGVAAPVRIEARASRRMLTRAEPWTNLVRLTAAGFAGAVGGADAVVLEPHDAALGASDPQGPRLARNVQLVLMEEGQLGRVADPAGGSYALEAHTEGLARAAWCEFQSIEAQGGLAKALLSGEIAGRVAAARDALAAALGQGRRRILNVTDFPPAEPPPPRASAPARSIVDPSPGGAPARCPPLTPIALEDLALEARS
jgi:methylmalonyl-CoA mutase